MNSEVHKTEMARRKNERSARNPGELWVLNPVTSAGPRMLLKYVRLSQETTRYSGQALRMIRARKVNFLGETQR